MTASLEHPDRRSEEELEDLLHRRDRDVLGEARAKYDRVAGPYGDRIVLFGAGELGQVVLRGLRRLSLEPVAFTDNNPQLWARDVQGVAVLSPEDALKTWNDRAIFVVCVYTSGPVLLQLAGLGCKRFLLYSHLFAKHDSAFLPFMCLGSPERIFDEADNILRAFRLFSSIEAQETYLTQIKRRLFLEFGEPPTILPPELRLSEYFASDIYQPLDEEVFVDCGAYDGDTFRRFLQLRKGRFRAILAVEPDPVNFERLRGSVANLPDEIRSRVHVRQAAVADRRSRLRFSGGGTMGSSVNPSGTMEVDAEPLDEMVADLHPTLIKMDLEGGEIEALTGSRRTIEREAPVLAVTVYHRADHLWRIPLMMASMRPEYSFFLRAHCQDCWDVSCYAVPPERVPPPLK